MLEVVNIQKTYENAPLLRGISFTVAAGETVCLLGPSGSGKSTSLRIIAGLEQAESGKISWDGQDLSGVPAHRRNFGLMFQDYALFPHLSVVENVAFGLRMQSLPKSVMNTRVTELLAQVNLLGFEYRRVTDLSGGEQQRVALARALAPRPRLLMLDEPLGALDRTLRESLLEELRGILRGARLPAIYVTHDQEEAFAIADRVLLLHGGEIVRSGSPSEVYANPGSAWVARFLGLGNVIEGRVKSRKAGILHVETAYGVFAVACKHEHREGEEVTLLLRPSGARLAESGLTGVVVDVLFQQDYFKVTFDNGLYFYLPDAPRLGEAVTLHLPDFAAQCLPDNQRRRTDDDLYDRH